jgi:diaminopimelate decarboxylase
MFNVESADELQAIDQVAGTLGLMAPIALRVNPDIDPQTHPYISTGLKKSKFGIPIEDALEYYRAARKMRNIRVLGIHKHIGSQITKISPFVDALRRVIDLATILRGHGIDIRNIDIGGGLGITYRDENPPGPSKLSKAVVPLLRQCGCNLILEPGRSIAGNAGIFVTRVLYKKKNPEKEFVIVDGGMNDLLRPSLYNAYHEILPVRKNRRGKILADIVGPICESGDFLARERMINRPDRGDLLAVMSSGAYGFSMSSNYNSRPRPAEVLVHGDRFFVVRDRETFRDLSRGSRIPDFLK